LQALSAAWQERAKAYLIGMLRRRADAVLPSRETRVYQAWMKERQIARRAIYKHPPQKGLVSILTTVWDGSPVVYLRALAESISHQNASEACEWVILDNGCTKPKLIECLHQLGKMRWVKVDRAKTNLGITRGLRRCLEGAKGRYVLPVDADDLLYPDALQVVSSAIIENRYPSLLYTDEDKINGSQHYQPYFKPDWDRVLLLNSAYIAHLGVIERKKALKLGAYSDPETEGSPDWDLFVRFLMAGEKATHIPEIVYSWRVHGASTADDVARKPYVLLSQRRVLQRFLNAQPCRELFELEPSPLFAGGDHWHFRRKPEQPKPCMTVMLGKDHRTSARQYAQWARALAQEDGLICFLGEDVAVEDPEWQWEVMGITELHSDVVMIGGRIANSRGRIVEAGLEFDFGDVYGSPNRGRLINDPGYFGQIWKQRSVSAVSTRFAALKARFLVELLESLPAKVSIGFLGAWAGAHALKTGKRVVYSPFLSGVSDAEEESPDESEKQLFRERYGVIRDARFYPFVFSRTEPYKLLAQTVAAGS
jgi:Glycosyl transferase family 2